MRAERARPAVDSAASDTSLSVVVAMGIPPGIAAADPGEQASDDPELPSVSNVCGNHSYPQSRAAISSGLEIPFSLASRRSLSL